MKAYIIKTDNSQDIRIPQQLLDQAGLGDEIEIEVQENQLVIRPLRSPRLHPLRRHDWNERFQE